MPIYTRNCLTMGYVGPYYYGFMQAFLTDRFSVCYARQHEKFTTSVLLSMIMIMIMLEIQGKGTACKPD